MEFISGKFGQECIELVEPARVLVTLHVYCIGGKPCNPAFLY